VPQHPCTIVHLDNNAILSVFQHGFRSGFSLTQLLTTVHDLMSGFDRNKQVDVAVLDLSKALDVPNRRLLGKLCPVASTGSCWHGLRAF